MPKVRDGYALSCNHSVNLQRAADTRSTQFHFLETESERHLWIPSRSHVARPRVRVDSDTRGSEASPESPNLPPTRPTEGPTGFAAPPCLHLLLGRRPPSGARDSFPAPRSTAEKSALKGQRADRPACMRAGGPRRGHAFPVPCLPRTSAPRAPAARSGGCGAGAWSGDAAAGRRQCSLRVGRQGIWAPRAGRCHRKGSAGVLWGPSIPVFQSFPGDSRRQPWNLPRSREKGRQGKYHGRDV
ncbi:uncharacterized protein [Kogia breviceps]|uniref:uncharacterized protein n=1 Tax=Kogia breviceps TaxID=27615 RepID=UPI0034D262A6